MSAVATTGSVIRTKDGNYEWEGKSYPSVTTILGGIEEVGLDKGLGFVFGNWTAKEACRILEAEINGYEFMRPAGWVRENDAFVKAYQPMDIPKWLASGELQKHLSKVGFRDLNCAADRGTLVHHAVGCLIRGLDITGSEVIAQFSDGLWPDDDAEGCIDALIAWWNCHDIKVIAHEISGLNTELGYGGTLDLVASINGEHYLIDFKTSADWRLSHLLQMSAYRAMDLWLENGTTPVRPPEIVKDLPCLVICVRPEHVRCFKVEPDNATKWFGQFKKLFDLKAGWFQKGQTTRLKDLQWEAF